MQRSNQRIPSSTRILLLGAAMLAILVLLGGIAAWSAGFARQDVISADLTNQALINSGKITPTIDPQTLESLYQGGIASAAKKDYAQAISQFTRLVQYRATYKDSAARLMLVYKTLGDQQTTDLGTLADAPATYGKALDLDKTTGFAVRQGFGDSPTLLGGGISYEVFLKNLQDLQNWSDHYAKGQAVRTDNPANNWWDSAITQWEPVYQANPDYLKNYPVLAISGRLVDTYQSKAQYLCRVRSDYAGALTAINRAQEIAYRSKLPDSKQAIILNLLLFINQSQCQTS